MGDHVRVQFPVPDIYFDMLPTTQANSAFVSPGSVNEDQLRLGRKNQVWFIPLADERGVCK